MLSNDEHVELQVFGGVVEGLKIGRDRRLGRWTGGRAEHVIVPDRAAEASTQGIERMARRCLRGGILFGGEHFNASPLRSDPDTSCQRRC